MSVPHSPPPPGFPLSTTPSQSLSTPSHVSAVGVPAAQLSTSPPLTHVRDPADAQAPTPHVVATAAIPSSTVPLQSLSTPSHVSAVGVPAAQLSTTTPLTHVRDPADAQAPTPHVVAPSAIPSSTVPLQPPPRSSHLSAVGVPAAQLSTSPPLTHVRDPADAQAPTPHVVATGAIPSSTVPLQSLSTPSHVSADAFIASRLSSAPLLPPVVAASETPALPVDHAPAAPV